MPPISKFLRHLYSLSYFKKFTQLSPSLLQKILTIFVNSTGLCKYLYNSSNNSYIMKFFDGVDRIW